MTVLLLAAALVVGTGAIAALAPRDVRLGLVGLTASLVAAAFVADPLPSPTGLAVRLSAAFLAVVVLRAAGGAELAREDHRRAEAARGWAGQHRESELGWPTEVLLGGGGAVAGLAIAAGLRIFTVVGGGDVGQPGVASSPALLSAPSLALAAAGLILAISLGPILLEAAGLRRAIALVLVTEATLLARAALVPTIGVLDEVVFGALLVAVAAGGAVLTIAGPRTRPATDEGAAQLEEPPTLSVGRAPTPRAAAPSLPSAAAAPAPTPGQS